MSFQNNQFEIRFATDKDDAELLAILEDVAMPGPIQLIYTRRPSPWISFHHEGQDIGVLICRDKINDCIVSLGAYVIKEMYLNKKERRVAYLFSLRSLKRYRLKFPLREGYEFLKNQLMKNKIDFIYTSIVEDNSSAVKLFFKRHPEFPVYQKLFQYATLCLNQQKIIKKAKKKNNIRKATINDLDSVFMFFQVNSCFLSCFPKIKKEELLDSHSEKYILNFYICYDPNFNIVGVMSVFNPSSYKQYVVVGYNWQFRTYNFFRKILPMKNLPRFPAINQNIENHFISYWLLSKIDAEMILDFIAFICTENVIRPFLLIGIPIDNPYFKVLHKFSYLKYTSFICQVSWENMPDKLIPTGPFYLECHSL